MTSKAGELLHIDGTNHRIQAVLKEDFFNRSLLLEAPGGELRVHKRALYFDGLFLFRPLAWWLSRRERELMRRAEGEGTPKVLWFSRGEYMTRYQEGGKLTDDAKVDDRFFPELQAIVARIHACGMVHNDLHKWENYLLTDAGRPFVMDFQLALHFPWGSRWRWWPGSLLFHFFRRKDEYHLLKKKRKLRPDQITDAERLRMQRTPIHNIFFHCVNRPMLHLKRIFIPKGSNDKLWFRVKKDQPPR